MRRPASPSPASLEAVTAALASGETTSVRLVRHYVRTIDRLDRRGPNLRAVIAINSAALAAASALDEERNAGAVRGPLHGAPILVKDNIETSDALPTTCGSLALKNNFARRDAPVVGALRAAGAIILGKANLSEWANFRSKHSISGWSAIGGQCRNALDPRRSPAGSSSGSAAAVAAGMAAAAVGTETDGSIVCPAAVHGLVGLKPTVGLVSRSGIVPISHNQDTAGPITLTVEDAARLLTAMAGSDAADRATAEADKRRCDYAAGLEDASLEGARIGVLRFCCGFHPETDALFARAIALIARHGGELVEIAEGPDRKALGRAEELILLNDFKSGVDAYLAATNKARVRVRTLSDLIAYNRAHAAAEFAHFEQELFEAAQATEGCGDAHYQEALATSRRLAGVEGIDRMVADHRLTALAAPTVGPAWLIDPILKDHYPGGRTTTLPAMAGYPHLTMPMGRVEGMPVGLSLIGPAWSEAALLGLGRAFEKAIAGEAPR